MKQTWLISILLLTYGALAAQEKCTVKIVFKNQEGQGVDDGMVYLLNTNDSSYRYATLQNSEANFDHLPLGNYQGRFHSLNFQDTTFYFNLRKDTIFNRMVRSNNRNLNEVQVVANRNTFSVRNGNIKAHVEGTLLSTLPDALEILARIPSVQVSNDRESIQLIGKGSPLIYLGRQRISLQDLSLISVQDIKSIELINNPSSAYESEGRAVILITRKWNKENGIKWDLSETASQKRLFENRMNFNSSIKKNRNEWKLNLQYNHINRWEGLDGIIRSNYNKYESGFNGTSIGLRQQGIAGLGYYRQLKNADYFSIQGSARWQDEFPLIHTDSYTQLDSTKESNKTQAINRQSRPFISTILNYQKTLPNKAGQLFVGAQFSEYERGIRNTIYNNPQNTTFTLTEKRKQQFVIGYWLGRMDYEIILTEKTKLESGIAFNKADSKTDFIIDAVLPSNNLNIRYHYHEINEAAYSQFSGRYKKWLWNAGVRLERTTLEGSLENSVQPLVNRHFLFVLPKVGLVLSIDSTHTISFNYANSVRRPDYSNLNQTTNYITPFLERSNNIYINPSRVHEFTLNFQLKNYSLKAIANYNLNPTYYITEEDANTHQIRMINRNLKNEVGANLMATIPILYKQFSSTNIASLGINQINGIDAVSFPTRPFYYLSSNNQFKFKRNYTWMMNAWLASTKYEGIFQHNAQYAVDFSLSKKIKNHWTISLNAFDIFRSLNYRETFQSSGVYSNILYLENVKEYSISIRYMMGSIMQSRFKNKEVNDQGNRLN